MQRNKKAGAKAKPFTLSVAGLDQAEDVGKASG